MRPFYHKLWVEKKTPMVALRGAQLWVLNNPDRLPELAASRGANLQKVVKLVEGGKRTSVSRRSSPRCGSVRRACCSVLDQSVSPLPGPLIEPIEPLDCDSLRHTRAR